MESDKLRVGNIGAGFYAVTNLIPQLRGTGRVEMVAISRRNPERLAAIQSDLGVAEAYTDWREMLDKSKLDAVVVSTPHNHHVEPALAALDRGLHVFVEKPIADSVDGALKIAEAAKKSGRVVTVGVNSRGTPVWRGVRAALQAKAIGQLRQINLVTAFDGRFFRQPVPGAAWVQQLQESSVMMRGLIDDLITPAHWRRDVVQMGGDVVMDVGAHDVDALLWIANSRPVEVVAFKPGDGAGASAFMTMQARLANDVLLSITFNDRVNEGDGEWGGYGTLYMTAIGDNGTLTVDSHSMSVHGAKEAWLERNGIREAVVLEGEVVPTVAAFVATVLDSAPNLCTAEEGAQTVALIQSAYRSAAEGRVVILN